MEYELYDFVGASKGGFLFVEDENGTRIKTTYTIAWYAEQVPVDDDWTF